MPDEARDTRGVGLLFGLQMVRMPSHEGQQAALPRASRIEVAPTGQKVLVNEANDVEAIGHNARVGEMFAYQSAVSGGQVHAHQTHPRFALQVG